MGVIARGLDVEGLEGFEEFSAFIAAINHGRTGNADFEAFAAHLLDEDGDLHRAAGGDVEYAGLVGVLDLEGNVGLDLVHQALADGAGGNVLAFLAAERAVVDGELHGNRRRVDLHERQCLLVGAGGEGLSDVDVLDARRDADDAARAATFRVLGGEAGIGKRFHDLGLLFRAVLAMKPNGIALFHGAAEDFPNRHAANKAVPLDV